jgi:hypothetical protein
MVPSDDGGHVPAIYGDFVEVFSKTKTETLPPHRSTDHAIDFEPGYNLPYGRIYNLSEFKLRTLKTYIEANLANGCYSAVIIAGGGANSLCKNDG